MPRKPKKSRFDAVLEYIVGSILFPFQREWVLDTARFKIGVKGRQIGLSLCLGLEGLLDALGGKPVYYVSRTEKQSVYLLEKFYKWADFFSDAGVILPFEVRNRSECRVGGIDVKSLTSNAVADEGYTGNVYLDEFALHENDERIYRSLYPTITWGYKIRIISRPFGQSNKFYHIFHNQARYPDYSRHRFDIYRAIRDGLPIDVEELKRNLDDEGFRENYECEFIDETTAFIPYQLIRDSIGEAPLLQDGNRFLGVDIGRKHDYTVVYVFRQLEGKLYTETIERLKNQTFDAQKAYIRGVIERGIQRGAVDSSGLGMQLAEELHRDYPFVEPVTFTGEIKEKMAVLTKRKFEERALQIPDDARLISSIHAVKRMVTAANNIRFDADRTALGHADEFWALALGVYAAFGRSRMVVRQY